MVGDNDARFSLTAIPEVNRDLPPGEDVFFQGSGVRLDLKSAGQWTVARSDHRCFALSGEVYRDYRRLNAGELASVAAAGGDWISSLDGSFILLEADREAAACRIYTDRTASRKIYYREDGSAVSDSLRLVAGSKPHLDEGACAAYLLNGIPLGGHVLFKGVRSVPYATCVMVQRGKLALQSYWKYRVDGSRRGQTDNELADEFGELLYAGIAARLTGDSRPLFLSLSGGYDSTCILASALRAIGPDKIRSFSYQTRHGATADADAARAAEASQRSGVEHRIVQIPELSLEEIVAANARRALGAANPCPDVALWESLDESLGFNAGTVRLGFGDNAFGHDPNWRLASHADALAWLPMPGPAEFDQLRPFLRAEGGNRAEAGFGAIFEEVMSAGRGLTHPVDEKDFFYFEQRVTHALMPWRDRFCGRKGEPVNPLLDARVLEFYGQIPAEGRRRRRIYRRAVERMYPEFFRHKRATSQGSVIAPRGLFARDADWLRQRIETLHPAMAELVSIEFLRELLPAMTQPVAARESGMKWMARRLLKNSALGEKARGFFPRSIQVARDVILLRLLIADESMKVASR